MGRQSHIVRDTVPGKIFATSEVRRQSPPAIDFHLFDFFPLAEFLVFLFNCNFSRIYYYFLLSFFWIDKRIAIILILFSILVERLCEIIRNQIHYFTTFYQIKYQSCNNFNFLFFFSWMELRLYELVERKRNRYLDNKNFSNSYLHSIKRYFLYVRVE